MKVAIFSPYRTVSPHFETELEIAQRHLDEGDSVQFINCTGELGGCDFNSTSDPDACASCAGRRTSGLFMLQPEPGCTGFDHDEFEPPEFDSVAELIAYQIDNFDLGYAALSSLVSIIRDPEPDLHRHRDMLRMFLVAGHRAYISTLNYIEKHQPDRIYVFNGRFAAMRGVLRACERMQVDCFLHERGCDSQHYEVLKNHLPHDIPAIEAAIRRSWDSADPTKRQQIGESWFEDRIERVERNWKSFVKEQTAGHLPEQWDHSVRNISIFCSSDDEFVAIGDCWTNHLYENQVVAVRRLADSLATVAPGTQLFLRVHPNLKDADNARLRAMLDLAGPNLVVVPPESPVDTYAMVRASDVVVSFGSSVGIEATFRDKPSVLLGPCFYRNLGGTYVPASHEEAVSLLQQNLAPLAKDGAVMYGHWLQTRGRPHHYYEASSLFEGKFRGELIYDRSHEKPRPTTLAGKLAREGGRIWSRLTSG
ncbi:MAG: hypothetical protein AAF456_23980 [Planctomycetota bacterium]